MIQKTLFDAPLKRARTTDPETSHEAASKAELTASATIDRCVEILRLATTPLTADEIAFRAVDVFFPEIPKGNGLYVTAVGNHRKRAHELHNKYGLAVIVEGKRNGARLMKLKERPCKN